MLRCGVIQHPFLLLVGILYLVSSCTITAFLPTSNIAPCTSSDDQCIQKIRQQPILPMSAPPRPHRTKCSTELYMGLRNFLKRKVLRKGGKPAAQNDDTKSSSSSSNDSNKLPQAAANGKPEITTGTTKDTSAATTAAASKQQQQQQQPVRMGEDPRTGKIDVESRLGPETVQERISRIKRGEMSQEEKEAFLKSALSTGSTPESRLPLKMGRSSSSSEEAKASPFPKDSILRDIAGGNKASKDPPPPIIDSQSKKRRYLDMVTDPRRFNNLSSGGGAAMKNNSSQGEDPTTTGEEEEKTEPAIIEEQPNLPQDLGARLGVAAMHNEKRNAEMRKHQQELERQQQQQRLAAQQRLAQAHQQRQEELAKREVDILQRRRQQEREQAQKQQNRQQFEAERRAELMKAQDDYWSKKLAVTKAAEQAKAAQRTKSEVDAEVDEEATNEDEENYNEAEANENTDQSTVNQTTTSAEVQPGRPPLLNDITTRASDYQSDQLRKKAELENEQMARLRSLNSPLPNRSKGTTDNARPIRKKTVFEPQVPANGNSFRGTSRQTPAQSLGDLTNTIKNSIAASSAAATKKPTSTPSKQQPSVPPSPPIESAAKQPPAPTPTPKEAPSNKGNAFNPFSRFGVGSGAQQKPCKAEPLQSTQHVSPAPKPSPRQSPPPPATGRRATAAAPKPSQARAPPPPPTKRKKGPIRMELPLGDDIDDDEEPAMTEGMTIGEIMKRQKAAGSSGEDQEKRSKQWGVDMSRFQD